MTVDQFIVQTKNTKDAGKNDPHGDGGRAINKAEKQLEQLAEQAKTATGKARDKIFQKIKNIRRDAAQKKKGETHHRK